MVTYYYDSNLAPYATDSSPHGFSVNQDFLASVKEGSTVDEVYGCRLSDEQRALARSMNVEKRVSYYVVCCVLCVW